MRDGPRGSTSEVHGRHLEVITRCLGELVGPLLLEDGVTDIVLNPDGRLWVTRLGHDSRPIGIMRAGEAEALIATTARTLGCVATRESPIVEGELLVDGSRFEGIIPPVVERPVFAIRRKAGAVFPLSSYETQGQMTCRQRRVIEAAVLGRRNILVSGGTGAGKTTMVNAILAAVATLTPRDRIVGIEDTRELRCAAEDAVFMRTHGAVTLRHLLRAALRLFPFRIVVGEVRGAEAFDLLMAWNTGHPGGVCTVHSDIVNPRAALTRLEVLVSLATGAPMRRLIAEAVGMIVCVERGSDGVRRVSRIVSVEGFDGTDYVLRVEDQEDDHQA
jgi:P-type conjugative transfer ATPase TrbB